jgi:hypothetical protein
MEKDEQLATLQDIRQLMQTSSRFVSLSGLSGIAAGICALVGAYISNNVIEDRIAETGAFRHTALSSENGVSIEQFINDPLFKIAFFTFLAAFLLAFIFTYLRSKKTNVPLWGFTARRLMISVFVPLMAGGFFLVKLIDTGSYSLIAPGCLIFYGLAVLNASKYTLQETRYLGYAEILLGVVNLFFVHTGLYFWAFGFGVLHILYGVWMWWKYESNTETREVAA